MRALRWDFRRIGFALLLGWAAAGAAEAGEVRAQCPAPDAGDYYFPEGTFSPPQEAAASDWDDDASSRAWYSAHLAAMQAPSLSCGPSAAEESYRFVWLRSFDAPIAVTISRSGGGIQASATVLSGHGGYDPGEPNLHIDAALAEADWDRLTGALAAVRFWDAQSRLAICRSTNVGAQCEALGLDGARWIFEGRRGGEYHVIDRWSPDAGQVRSLGLVFLELSGLPEQDRVY